MQSDGQGQNSLNMEQSTRFNQFSPFMFTKSKRIRNKNWELLEIQVLKKMIDNQYELLNSRHTNAMINARKNLVWRRIADSINALGLHRRSVREIKIKWSNMRLTEKRKSGNQPSSTGAAPNIDDVVDMSQSSVESELEKHDESDQQTLTSHENETRRQNPTSGVFSKGTPDLHNEMQRVPTTCSITNDIDANSTETEAISAQDSERNEFRHTLSGPEATNMSLGITSVHQYINRAIPPHIENSMQFHPRSSHEQEYERVEQNSSQNATNFNEERIYMPGVIIKPEPTEQYTRHERSSETDSSVNCNNTGQRWSNIPYRQSATVQTDWSLSTGQEYQCPSANVTETEIMTRKYEILKLEKEHLRLKNENMELQNAKLRIELTRLQNNM